MRIQTLSCLTLALAATLVGACAHETTPPPAIPKVDYRVGVDDVIEVAVWKDPALSATVPVRPDGKISLPMIGDVMAVGRTTHELEAELRDKLKAIISEPTVAVMVKEVHASRIYVLGEVAHPGAYPMNGHVNILQALAIAGGPTEFARRGRMVVIRAADPNKEPARYSVDYDSVVDGKAQAIHLVAGDTVFVP